MKVKNTIISFFKHFPIAAAFFLTAFSLIPVFIYTVYRVIISGSSKYIISPEITTADFESLLGDIFGSAVITVIISTLMVLPAILTLYNIFYLFSLHCEKKFIWAGKRIEFFTIIVGTVYSIMWSSFDSQIMWESDWNVQLYNSELHTPIATWAYPTIITIAAVAVTAYLFLRFVPINKMSPLVLSLLISGLYLGIALSLIMIIQLIKNDFPLCVLPFNVIIIGLKTIKEILLQWREFKREIPQGKSKFITLLYKLFNNVSSTPLLGLILLLPLLGIIIAVLSLFGQAPDSIIRAWTETADWTFSQQIPPQNIYQDMHYLCTVAAGGHKKVVKPLRIGMRHGHRVVVNRQLCIANAFEQLLEERIPRLHRVIRKFYDKYGYPIAKHIKSPFVADVIWFVMKPLEWLFLITLYLFDLAPENRIALQYPHANIPDFTK